MPRATKTKEETTEAKPKGATAHIPPEPEEIVSKNLLDPNKIESGDTMAIISYVTVQENIHGKLLAVRDLYDKTNDYTVRGENVLTRCFSANRYEKEEFVSKTCAAEVFVEAHNRPLTVKYLKQDGEERTLVGKFEKQDNLMGRSWCTDFWAKKDDGAEDPNKLRLVDHRSISELIVNGIKWIVKNPPKPDATLAKLKAENEELKKRLAKYEKV